MLLPERFSSRLVVRGQLYLEEERVALAPGAYRRAEVRVGQVERIVDRRVEVRRRLLRVGRAVRAVADRDPEGNGDVVERRESHPRHELPRAVGEGVVPLQAQGVAIDLV